MMDVVAHMRDWPWHFPMTEPVLVGVSGGVDSMVLVGALVRAGWTGEVVVHVNHQLRGEAAEADEELVRTWAGCHGLGLESGRGRRGGGFHWRRLGGKYGWSFSGRWRRAVG